MYGGPPGGYQQPPTQGGYQGQGQQQMYNQQGQPGRPTGPPVNYHHKMMVGTGVAQVFRTMVGMVRSIHKVCVVQVVVHKV